MALLIFNDDTTDNDGLRVENQWYTECMQCGLCLARLQFYCRVTRYCLCVAARRIDYMERRLGGFSATVQYNFAPYCTFLSFCILSLLCHYVTAQHDRSPYTPYSIFSLCRRQKEFKENIEPTSCLHKYSNPTMCTANIPIGHSVAWQDHLHFLQTILLIEANIMFANTSSVHIIYSASVYLK